MKYKINVVEKTLENGLHVVLVEKPDYEKSLFMCAIPSGGFDVVQYEGNDKIVHKSGCAHFLEHQMFRLDGKDITDEFAKMQAQTNAFTSYTETAYYFQTTSSVEEPLALLLDFVETLDIDEASVEKEKGIILSEYNMYDQNPEQKLLSNTWKALYKNHPLVIDILGTKDDIANMTVSDLRRFYRMNYDPSRLCLIGITGKPIDSILSFIERHQANVPSMLSGSVHRIFADEPESVVLKESVEFMDISTPYVCVAYKCKPCATVEEAMKLDLAVQMRLDSMFGPLNPEYQDWLDARIISANSFAQCDFSRDHGYVLFVSQTDRVDAFISLIESLIKEFKESMDPACFQAIQVRMQAQNVRSLDNFDVLAYDLLSSKFEGYDHLSSLAYVDEMNPCLVSQLCKSLSFDNHSIIKIYPKSSIESK